MSIRNKRDFIRYFNQNIRPVYDDKIIKGAHFNKDLGQLRNPFELAGLILNNKGGLFKLAKNFNETSAIKAEILNDIIPKILPGFSYSAVEAISEEDFWSYKMISPSLMDRFRSEDAIIGFLNDTNKLRISECEISKKEEDHFEKVFSGIVVELDLNIHTDYHLVISRKEYHPSQFLNLFDLFSKSDIQEISIANVFLDSHYKILTNDTIKTNKIFEPRILDKITQFLEAEHSLNFAITKNKFIILIERDHNIFEIFDEGRFEPEAIWDDLMYVFESAKYIEGFDIDFSKI